MKALQPDATLLIMLGSIITHFDEYTSETGRPEDLMAARTLLELPSVKEWIKEMHGAALLPVKR